MSVLNIKDSNDIAQQLGTTEINGVDILHKIIQDKLGNAVTVGSFGELKAMSPRQQVSHTFDTPLDEVFDFKVATSGDCNITAQHNRSLLLLNTGTGGTGSIESKRIVRYKTSTVECLMTMGFPEAPQAVDQRFGGLFNNKNGYYWGYDGLDFIFAYRNKDKNGGTEPDVKITLDMSAYDLTKIHRFRLTFGFLGVADATLEIRSPTGWELIGKHQTDGQLSDRTHIGTVNIPVRTEISSPSNDISILSGSWSANTWDNGEDLKDKTFFSSGARTIATAANELPIVAFRSKLDFGGYENNVRTKLLYSEFATGSEGLYKINIYAYPAGTITDGAWADVSATSVMEENVTTNYNTYPAKPMLSTHLAVPSSGVGVAESSVDFEKLGVIANPGDEFLITKQELIAGAGDDITSWVIAGADLF